MSPMRDEQPNKQTNNWRYSYSANGSWRLSLAKMRNSHNKIATVYAYPYAYTQICDRPALNRVKPHPPCWLGRQMRLLGHIGPLGQSIGTKMGSLAPIPKFPWPHFFGYFCVQNIALWGCPEHCNRTTCSSSTVTLTAHTEPSSLTKRWKTNPMGQNTAFFASRFTHYFVEFCCDGRFGRGGHLLKLSWRQTWTCLQCGHLEW